MKLKDLLAITDNSTRMEIRLRMFDRMFETRAYSDYELNAELLEKEISSLNVYNDNDVPTIAVRLK